MSCVGWKKSTGLVGLLVCVLLLGVLSPAGAATPSGITETRWRASDPAPGDSFGHSIAADGDTFVVGAAVAISGTANRTGNRIASSSAIIGHDGPSE